MKFSIAMLALLFSISPIADADVWKWVDANGKTHFVDTMKPIYTWIDDWGKTHYGDTPDHEDAVSIDLVWHSTGRLEKMDAPDEELDKDGYEKPGETAEDRAEREKADATYCKRATEIYESYLIAPQLYRTTEDGEREFLSEEQAARTIAEIQARRDEICP